MKYGLYIMLCGCLPACTPAPQLNPAFGMQAQGTAPQIVPLAPILAQAPAAGAYASTDPSGLAAKAAALRAKTAQPRPMITQGERERLMKAVE